MGRNELQGSPKTSDIFPSPPEPRGFTMLCHQLKCIYVHIPKAAGTSVNWFFIKHLGIQDNNWRKILLLGKNQVPRKGPPSLSHLKASEYVQYGYLSEKEFSDYFKFSFVRNPWARLVSEYLHRGHPVRYSFKKWVFEKFPEKSWTDEYLHVIPQYEYLHDAKGTMLVNFVGKVERIDFAFRRLCSILGIPENELPHRNRSSIWAKVPRTFTGLKTFLRMIVDANRRQNTFRRYQEYYDAETRDYVETLYRKDIVTFGYTFDSIFAEAGTSAWKGKEPQTIASHPFSGG
jgi:hypothetical protein